MRLGNDGGEGRCCGVNGDGEVMELGRRESGGDGGGGVNINGDCIMMVTVLVNYGDCNVLKAVIWQ